MRWATSIFRCRRRVLAAFSVRENFFVFHPIGHCFSLRSWPRQRKRRCSRSTAARSASPTRTSPTSRRQVEAHEARSRALLPLGRARARSRASATGRSCSSASSTAPRASRSTRSARPTSGPQWLRTVTLSFPSGRTAEEVVVDDAAGLAWIVNLGCIELHPHPVRAGDLDHPDELRVDLDPGPGRRLGRRPPRGARGEGAARRAGLRGWPKTSGSRGMHVNVRIEPRWTFTEVRRAALALSREIERRAPDARHLEVVEGGAPRRLPRLQPERQGSHHLLGLLGAPAARRARVDAARLGRGPRLRAGRLHGARPCRRASPAIGDPHAGMDEARRLARRAARARRARRGRGSRRRAVAAALPQDGGRGAARRAVAREGRRRHGAATKPPRDEDAARSSSRNSPEQGRGARGPRALEGAGTPRRPRTSPSTTCWSTRCAAARRRGRASASTCATCPEAIRPPQETPDPGRRPDARVARSGEQSEGRSRD